MKTPAKRSRLDGAPPVLDLAEAYERGRDDGMIAILELISTSTFADDDDELYEWTLDAIAVVQELRTS